MWSTARHPEMTSPVAVIAERLGAGDGFLYRYLAEESDDGLAGHEAFLRPQQRAAPRREPSAGNQEAR